MAEKQPAPDINRLIAAVAARHHVLLKPDDAAFALVTLNQLVLEDSIKELAGHIRAATTEFVSSFERVQEHAGAALAKTHRQINVELHAEMEKSIVKLTSAASSAHSDDVDQSFRSDADQRGAKRRRALSV